MGSSCIYRVRSIHSFVTDACHRLTRGSISNDLKDDIYENLNYVIPKGTKIVPSFEHVNIQPLNLTLSNSFTGLVKESGQCLHISHATPEPASS